MAAQRKFSEAQRAEVFRLHEVGLTSKEISEACAQGSTSTAPFHIPRRTVSDIAAKMAKEAEMRLPSTLFEIEGAKAVDRFPSRVVRIIASELDHLEAKQKKGRPLSSEDLNRLDKAAKICGSMTEKRRRAERRQGSGKRPKASAPPESVLDRLAREQREE